MSRVRIHYAWIVLALCCFGLLAAQGVRLAFGAFILPWERDFGADRGAMSLVSFLSFVVYGLTQPLVGRLVDRHGARRVLAASVLLVGLSLLAIAQVRSAVGLLVLYGVLGTYVPGALHGRLGGYQLVFAATTVALAGAASLSFTLPPARRERRLLAAAGVS